MYLPSLKLTLRIWKWVVGIFITMFPFGARPAVSFWTYLKPKFLGLVSQLFGSNKSFRWDRDWSDLDVFFWKFVVRQFNIYFGRLTAGTYKSPMKRKEHYLKQSSMIMLHVNLQECTLEVHDQTKNGYTWMIHVPDSRSYQWTNVWSTWTSWIYDI